MPGFVIHLAMAKEYLKRHKEDGEDEEKFYRGVIAPDLLKKPESHYGPSTSEPDFERYAKEAGLSDSYICVAIYCLTVRKLWESTGRTSGILSGYA